MLENIEDNCRTIIDAYTEGVSEKVDDLLAAAIAVAHGTCAYVPVCLGIENLANGLLEETDSNGEFLRGAESEEVLERAEKVLLSAWYNYQKEIGK